MCVPHKISIFSQVIVVQQYKKVTNYAPNSEREKDKARAFTELSRRHTFLLQIEAGELFLSAQFSFVFSSIRFLSLVFTQIFALLIVDTISTASSDFCRICSLPYQPLLPILSKFDIDIVIPCTMTTLTNTSISILSY